jgi:hypothetical protein
MIQIWHTRNSHFHQELYEPIKNASFFHEHTFIFPHDGVDWSSKETLKNIDLFIAEVSTPATGLWIELGFASAYGKKILCIYKKWSKISASLKLITENFIEYDSSVDMIEKVGAFFKNI